MPITKSISSVYFRSSKVRVMKNNESTAKYFLLAEEYQRKGNYTEAIEHYNLSLCYAPAKSEFSFASLTNRSQIYYKVKQYQHALENLEWAKEIKPLESGGGRDLPGMMTVCKEKISSETAPLGSSDIFQLTLPLNERLVCCSACLELNENDIYGRYFTTNKDLSPGDVIVAEEPFFKVIDSKVSHLRCCICCSTNSYSLIPCDNCTGAMFCSNECKNSTIHGRECEPSGKGMDTLEEYMLQRMFYQAIDICGSLDQLKTLVLSETEQKTILDFDFRRTSDEVNKRKIILAVSGLDKRDPGSIETYSRYQKIIDRLSTETATTDDFLNNYLVRCLQSLTVNFFHFFWNPSNDTAPQGFLLCALSAFFSHSCDPNIEKVDVDNKLVFVAKKPIKAGEQLNMCYDRYNFMRYSLAERQSYLNEVYKFKCNCNACVNDYAKYDFKFDANQFDMTKAKEKYRKNCEFVKQNMSSYPCESICKVMEENVFLLNYIGNGMPF